MTPRVAVLGAGSSGLPVAKALVDLGLKLVGLDYLSAAAANEQVAVHRAFLDHGVILLEGVDLSDVPPGRYELFCPPVKLAGSDGAPCRAVLRELVVSDALSRRARS